MPVAALFFNYMLITHTDCSSNCAVCTGGSSCTSCQSTFYLNGGQCVAASSCPTGIYANTTTRACASKFPFIDHIFMIPIDCPSNCAVCPGSSSCTTCQSNFYINSGQCLAASSCPAGTYANTTTQTCDGTSIILWFLN